MTDLNLDEYNSFYQLLNHGHPLVTRVGEESQGYSLKFESVWNNPKSQMWILRCFEHDYQV
jgi:hypothetical protein